MFVEITDLVIRLPALGILGLLFCVMWKQRGHSLAVKLALALIASVFFLTLSNSTLFPDVTAPQRIVLRLLDAPNVVFLWLFVRSLFEDRFKITNWDYAIGGIYIALMVWERLGEAGLIPLPGFAYAVIGAASFLIIGHLILSVLLGWRGDLINQRRRSRLILAGLCAAAGFMSVLATNSQGFIPTYFSQIISAGIITVASFLAAIYVLNFEGDRVTFTAGKDVPVLSAKDRDAHKKLITYIEVEKAYLNPNLSMGKIARHIGVAEHHLRTLINQQLGYRNYTDFINRYRIAHAKAELSDFEKLHIPILNLALDSGYNSLSAFNRAFKAIEDMTPSTYRKQINPDQKV